MRAPFALALVVALVGGAAVADDKEALKQLEGTYLLVGLEAKGLKLDAEKLKGTDPLERKIVIKGDQIIAYMKGGKEDPGTIKLDASKSPPHIDITSTKDGKTEVNYGIYKFEKGVLTICTLERGDPKDRPKEFKADDKALLLVLEKQPAK